MSDFKVSLDNIRKTRRLVESLVHFRSSLSFENLVIRLQRNSVHDGKPVYVITIYGNAQVIYQGIKSVKIIGEQRGYITRNNLQQLLNEFENVYFFSFKDIYGNQGNDSTSGYVAVSITVGNDTKKVLRFENYEGPSGLIQLEMSIDRIVNSYQWTGIVNR